MSETIERRLTAADVKKLREAAQRAESRADRAIDAYREGLAQLTADQLRQLARSLGLQVRRHHRTRAALLDLLT